MLQFANKEDCKKGVNVLAPIADGVIGMSSAATTNLKHAQEWLLSSRPASLLDLSSLCQATPAAIFVEPLAHQGSLHLSSFSNQ